MNKTSVLLRKPTQNDARDIWELVRRCSPLDPNSSYTYLLLCTHFSDTCVVATNQSRIVGFVSGYVEPGAPEKLFIWQVAVDETARGNGLGRAMLLEILLREHCRQVTHLETTVAPSNETSRRMFHGLAERMRTELDEKPYFESGLLAEGDHEDENLITIGPFRPVQI